MLRGIRNITRQYCSFSVVSHPVVYSTQTLACSSLLNRDFSQACSTPRLSSQSLCHHTQAYQLCCFLCTSSPYLGASSASGSGYLPLTLQALSWLTFTENIISLENPSLTTQPIPSPCPTPAASPPLYNKLLVVIVT